MRLVSLAAAANRPPLTLGIVNVTPDSFSDGGQFISPSDAIEFALDLIEYGADAIDVGGESSRPGAQPVSVAEEISRVVPVIAGIRRGNARIPISIDTTKATVAQAALAAGATVVNDISAGRFDPDMFACVHAHDAEMICMHMHGAPRTMQDAPQYTDVVREVRDFFCERIAAAQAAGIARDRLLIDPGIGFGKTPAHNIALLQSLRAFTTFGVPVVLGVSRKSIIGHLLGGAGVSERLEGGLAITGLAASQGVRIFRTHDIPATRRYLTVWAQLFTIQNEPTLC